MGIRSCHEGEAVCKWRQKEKSEQYFDNMKKRLELEKLGAEKEESNKIFPLSHLDNDT